jgi:hypothetical protein
MTLKQFRAACERHGINPNAEVLGYHQVTGYREGEVGGLRVCALNAGTRRRDQLAYLIKRRDTALEHDACEAENRAKLETIIGEREKEDPGYRVYHKGIYFDRLKLTVEEGAAVIKVLRELRASEGVSP